MTDAPAEMRTLAVDLCIIGAGAGGIALATMAAAFGRRVVLIEKHRMGGDGLNYGSVPVNALLAAARRSQDMRTASAFGIAAVEPEIDHAAVNLHVTEVIAQIAPNAAAERLAGLGIQVISAAARFVNRTTVAAGEYRIAARRFVIATGSSPLIPPIPGLAEAPYFTNETIFDNKDPIPHLIVIGAGSTGIELAQAYRRLGSQVTVIDSGSALSGEEPELADVLLTQLASEGITFRENTHIKRVSGTIGRMRVDIDGENEPLEGTAVLVAAGRKANLADLGLDAAGVKTSGKILKMNPGLKTTNRRIFAIGDAAGGPRYAHVATENADRVLRSSLFRMPGKANDGAAARVTFTEPQLASVGMNEAEAHAKHGRVHVLRFPYHEIARAQIERKPEGHVKVITTSKGEILGAAIVGADAAEVIQMWSLALSQRMNIKAMTAWISPYPTFSEINRKVAVRYFATLPSNPVLRKVIALLDKLG